MFKNVSSQKIAVFAYDSVAGTPMTGDGPQLTAYVNKDWAGITVLGDTSATEISSTNAAGWYLFDLTQAETNGDTLHFTGKSSTSGIYVAGSIVQTVPANFTSFVAALDAAATRVAIGLASANLDTQLSAAGMRAAIGLASANLDVQLSGISSAPTTAQIADKILGRNVEGGADGGRTVSEAFYFNRNKVQINGSVLSVYMTDDTTISWTGQIFTDSDGLPITGLDPS